MALTHWQHDSKDVFCPLFLRDTESTRAGNEEKRKQKLKVHLRAENPGT